jgi:predicted DNA-binding ribbon-helix-helix protein
VSAEEQLLSLESKSPAPEGSKAVFRVVGTAGTRRALKLEKIFWDTLGRMAGAGRSRLSSVVEEIASQMPADANNLSSAIRVACTHWVLDENEALAKLASFNMTNSILAACPSPAFSLSSSRKILSFNAAFQQLVRRQLPLSPDADEKGELKLALDLNIAEIFERLAKADDRPVSTGFVIGAGERRYRGQLSVVRAPLRQPLVLLAFVA